MGLGLLGQRQSEAELWLHRPVWATSCTAGCGGRAQPPPALPHLLPLTCFSSSSSSSSLGLAWEGLSPGKEGGPRKAGPCSPVGHSWLGAAHPDSAPTAFQRCVKREAEEQQQELPWLRGLTQNLSPPTCSPTTAQHPGPCRCPGFSWDRASSLPSSRYRAVFGIWDENNADNTPMFWCC